MKHQLLMLSTILLLILLILVTAVPEISVRGEPNDFFIINNADGSNTFTMSSSSPLWTLIQNVNDRIILQYAKASKIHALTPIPQTFMSLIQGVEDRFVIQYANASNTFALGYPIDMIGDTTAPTITSVEESPSGGSILVTVISSEYTLAELQYGTSSGNFPNSLGDNLYRYSHTFTLPKPVSGETIYYRVILADRSSNVTISPEYTLEQQDAVYLPLLRR
jgi:hypothetical protein